MLYLLVDSACHELDAASALVFLRDAHSVDLHVIRDPQDVCDWRSVAELCWTRHSTGLWVCPGRSHPQTQAEK